MRNSFSGEENVPFAASLVNTEKRFDLFLTDDEGAKEYYDFDNITDDDDKQILPEDEVVPASLDVIYERYQVELDEPLIDFANKTQVPGHPNFQQSKAIFYRDIKKCNGPDNDICCAVSRALIERIEIPATENVVDELLLRLNSHHNGLCIECCSKTNMLGICPCQNCLGKRTSNPLLVCHGQDISECHGLLNEKGLQPVHKFRMCFDCCQQRYGFCPCNECILSVKG